MCSSSRAARSGHPSSSLQGPRGSDMTSTSFEPNPMDVVWRDSSALPAQVPPSGLPITYEVVGRPQNRDICGKKRSGAWVEWRQIPGRSLDFARDDSGVGGSSSAELTHRSAPREDSRADARRGLAMREASRGGGIRRAVERVTARAAHRGDGGVSPEFMAYSFDRATRGCGQPFPAFISSLFSPFPAAW